MHDLRITLTPTAIWVEVYCGQCDAVLVRRAWVTRQRKVGHVLEVVGTAIAEAAANRQCPCCGEPVSRASIDSSVKNYF